MRKSIFLIVILFCCSSAYAFYDFCETPADYNTFPQAYDVRTEYWKNIPNYSSDDIKYEDIKNEHPIFPFKFMKKQTKSKENTTNN